MTDTLATPLAELRDRAEAGGVTVLSADRTLRLADGPHTDRIITDAQAGRLTWAKAIYARGRAYSHRHAWQPQPHPCQDLEITALADRAGESIGDYNPFPAPAPAKPRKQTGGKSHG